jgi:cation:H+ antiporter
MSLLQSLAYMAGGFALLIGGAEGLVRGAASSALRFGLTPLVVGLTVVAFGTSSPELVICIEAAMRGEDGLAIGNVVGSNIANLALIVGVAALIAPALVQRKLVRVDLPTVLGISVILALMLFDGAIGRIEGAVLAAGAVGFVWANVKQARRETRRKAELIAVAPADAAEAEMSEALDEVPDEPRPLWQDALLVALGFGLLVIGGDLLLEGAIAAARQLDVSDAVIGLTLVALGTSLPELATTVVASLRGHSDIALGNAVGSNAFNVLGVLGPAALIAPLTSSGVGMIDLGIMLGITALLPLSLWFTPRLTRGHGVVLIGLYGAYVWFLLA